MPKSDNSGTVRFAQDVQYFNLETLTRDLEQAYGAGKVTWTQNGSDIEITVETDDLVSLEEHMKELDVEFSSEKKHTSEEKSK
ncbi:Ff.00g000830.m01.CDS01 [Fusarium sp. VM40]|nr:Ff.00g000830.m01.CDS01 [Fusarium sp. VM40]